MKITNEFRHLLILQLKSYLRDLRRERDNGAENMISPRGIELWLKLSNEEIAETEFSIKTLEDLK